MTTALRWRLLFGRELMKRCHPEDVRNDADVAVVYVLRKLIELDELSVVTDHCEPAVEGRN